VINLGLGGPAISTAERPVVRDHDVLSSEPVERHGDGALSRGALGPRPGACRLAAQRQDQAAERGMRAAGSASSVCRRHPGPTRQQRSAGPVLPDRPVGERAYQQRRRIVR